MSSVNFSPAGKSARARMNSLHEILRDRICFLDYAPGDRLSEEALAEEFGISRTPLRRVLAKLEEEGLVRAVHGVGTLVTDADLTELKQVYQLRMELAVLATRLDPIPADAALQGEFRALQRRSAILDASRPAREFTRINIDFFLAVQKLSGNEPLRQINKRLYYQTCRIWLQSVFSSRIDLANEIRIFQREVEEIVHAVELGDLAAVGHLTRAHISMSFSRFRQS